MRAEAPEGREEAEEKEAGKHRGQKREREPIMYKPFIMWP